MDYLDFPFWLRFAHFINVIFITILIRSGIEIFSALPKLYWNDHAIPGTEWLKLTKKKLPEGRAWTSLEEEESYSSWIALPGHKNLGLGRHWHFLSIIFWIANGLAYCILLFTSNEWHRLIPTDWSILPKAIDTALIYTTFHIPPPGDPYNPLQQMMYFAVMFLLGPFMILTGAAMSPTIAARFPGYVKIFRGRQIARSLHFLGMVLFILFIVVHVSMVFIERFPQNMGNIALNNPNINWVTAGGLFAVYVVVIAIIHLWVTSFSLRKPRIVQNSIDILLNPLKKFLFYRVFHVISKQEHTRSEASTFFRTNGSPPITKEYQNLKESNFSNWKLKINGLVERPVNLSLPDLRNMKKQLQVTEHYCIQGWTAIGEWGGVPMKYIVSLCRPLPEAKYVVFKSYQICDGSEYYEVLGTEEVNRSQTILAYEMNGKPLEEGHGAPLRLRVETQLGYKMVKWLRSIEFVSDYKNIGLGQGGHREDHMYYSRFAEI